jgi:hypothetical protein
MHSYGYAIDINPLENPYHDPKEGWWPAAGAANADRGRATPGALTTHAAAFESFTRHGWVWGGLFHDAVDYMHFEKGTFGARPNPLDAPYAVNSLTYQK